MSRSSRTSPGAPLRLSYFLLLILFNSQPLLTPPSPLLPNSIYQSILLNLCPVPPHPTPSTSTICLLNFHPANYLQGDGIINRDTLTRKTAKPGPASRMYIK
ncbi:hypothetical protein HDV62DRAFT_91652 [Trichoderma sp. SZMC 28011]